MIDGYVLENHDVFGRQSSLCKKEVKNSTGMTLGPNQIGNKLCDVIISASSTSSPPCPRTYIVLIQCVKLGGKINESSLLGRLRTLYPTAIYSRHTPRLSDSQENRWFLIQLATRLSSRSIEMHSMWAAASRRVWLEQVASWILEISESSRSLMSNWTCQITARREKEI